MSSRNPTKRQKAAVVDAALARSWPEARTIAGRAKHAEADLPNADPGVADRVEAIWNDVPLLRGRERYAELLGPPTWRERMVGAYRDFVALLGSFGRVPALATAAAMIMIVAVTIPMITGSSGSVHRFETAKAQTEQIELEDGSRVTLGARSALQVDYRRRSRNVVLAAGEAFFSVTHNPSRPFIVTAGDTIVEVAGTKFNVNRTTGGVRVSVLEGVVHVIDHRSSDMRVLSSAPEEVALRSGQQATVAAGAAPVRVSALTITQPGSWRTGSLAYEDAPLDQIVADANRYYPHDIRIASARAAQMRLTTAFKSTQVDQFLETVETALPLEVKRAPDGEVTIVDRR
jgi:transmembrane sensor